MSRPEENDVVALDGGEPDKPPAWTLASRQGRRAAVVERRSDSGGEARPWDRTRLGPPS